LLSTEQ